MVIEALPPNTHPATASEPNAGTKMIFSDNVKLSPTIPAFIPAHQTYYWSRRWQESEQQALTDLANGHVQTFADPSDAVHYLLGEPE
jgi:hypothetical protein